MTELIVSDLTVNAGDKTLVSDASFSLSPREFVCLLGPNGAGKTSLIRAALGLQKSTHGLAEVAGTDTRKLHPAERAKCVSYLPQIRPLAWPSRVGDVVALGRFSYGAASGRLKPADLVAVQSEIERCELEDLAQRNADTLSGGELARMHCARAFAAETPLFVADEPTAALDPRHQFRILELIKAYVAKGGGALVVLHDIQMAARYASRLIWMKEGRILADGTPEDTLTVERLKEIYGINASIDGRRVEVAGPV